MMRVFVDTSFYLAMLNPRDEHHTQAVAVSHEQIGQRVTTEFVLLEVANFLSKTPNRGLFELLASRLRQDRKRWSLNAHRRGSMRALHLSVLGPTRIGRLRIVFHFT
jgi:predicted nucleic acid-binding protein